MASWSRRQFLGVGALAAVSGCTSSPEPQPAPEPSPAPPPVPAPVRARRAEDLCQSYAVNTKTYYDTAVYGHTDAVIDLLRELGVRTVRERAAPGTSPGAQNQRYAMPRLADRGIRWHATVGGLEDWPVARAATAEVIAMFTDYYLPLVGGDLSVLMHSFGGCNEVDGPVLDGRLDPAWAAHARLMQTELWRQVQANPRTAGIPVVGPSTRTDVTVARAEELGDLSAVSDWGNAHLYGAGSSPTRGIDRHLAILARCYPDASKWFFTETGYNNSPQTNAGRSVSEAAAASYAIRGLCDFFVRGCIYGRFELLDDPDPINLASQTTINATADQQAHFGLVAMPEESVTAATPDTWRKKPEFYATQRLLTLLSDPGPAWTPEALDLALSGNSPDLQQTLLQKRDGRHYLLLWRDVRVATTFPSARPLEVPVTPVTVHLRSPRTAAIYSPRDRTDPIRTQAPRRRIDVEIGGDLVVVEIG